MVRSRFQYTLAITLLAALLVTACSGGQAGQDPGSGGGTSADPSKPVRIGMGALGATLDPHACLSTLCFTPFYAIYDALTAIDQDGNIQPSLATSWDNPTDTTWELKLREGVTFHNGEPFNAEAVKFTFDRVIDEANALPAKGRVPLLESVEVVDDMTVRFTTSSPDPLFLGRLSVVFIIPPQHFADVGAPGLATQGVGTGAWEVAEFDPEQRLVLKAAANSWRGKPAAEEIQLISLPDDGARVSALQAGDVDMIQNVPIDHIASLERAGMKIEQATLGRIHMANLSTTRNSPLDDVRVRQAINYAVDKEALLRDIMQGYGVLAQGQMVGPGAVGHNPAIEPYPYDPDKARELLAEAGYPDGFKIKWDGPSGAYLQDKPTQEFIVSQLKDVGIEVELQFMEQAAYLDGLLKGALAPISFLGWNYFPIMDADFIYVWFHSSNATNIYNNPEFDRLFDESRVTMDPVKRQEILDELAQIVHDDVPGLYLFYPPDIFALRADVSGFVPRSDTVIWLDALVRN